VHLEVKKEIDQMQSKASNTILKWTFSHYKKDEKDSTQKITFLTKKGNFSFMAHIIIKLEKV